MPERSLTESVFARAWRDIHPKGWRLKWIRSGLGVMGLATAYYYRKPSEVLEHFSSIVVAGLIFLIVELVIYSCYLPFAAVRQRNDLRGVIIAAKEAQRDFARLEASTERATGRMRRLVVRNTGTRTIRAVSIQLPPDASSWIVPEGWRSGEEHIEELQGGQQKPFLFRACHEYRQPFPDPAKARIAGKCDSRQSVECELVLEPADLL